MRTILAVVITVFWSFNHGLASLAPHPEEKLVTLSNIYASYSPCMAYREEDNQNFITSKQCRDRVLQLTDVQFVQAITHTADRLVIEKGNIRAPDVVRFSDTVENIPADRLSATAWYPEFRHDNTVVFHSVAVRLTIEPQLGYRILAPPAGLVSGSPVFLGMELMCIFSGESSPGGSSQCERYDDRKRIRQKRSVTVYKHLGNHTLECPDHSPCDDFCDDENICSVTYHAIRNNSRCRELIRCASGATCTFTLEKSYCEAGACKFKECENGCYGSGDKLYCNKDSTTVRVVKLIVVFIVIPVFAIAMTLGACMRIKRRLDSGQ
ncbi:hypothetical protein [Endozoicomonas euniceicola]|uniref:Uncharacterized protein n=1 Tax=Endozoicomonas euniceicola TaxID=1234143 RepID=A0ABY6GX85_9GAMM|nr:hypothetical protein [Endozoicomonas euniceicola]UYM16666.1 hypothetical protein NX720_01665 [Endozoicomonas euniceicola]